MADKKVPTKKPVAKKEVTVNAAKPVKPVAAPLKKESTLRVAVVDLSGTTVETLSLPEAVFGAKANPTLVAQAVRVYLANQRQGTASTKTRGEVTGSTKKIYRQKGTGNARHGGKRAPIFVHGGIAHGPHPRDYSLSLSQKMRKAALNTVLSEKLAAGQIKVITGLETVAPKTKAFTLLAQKLALLPNKRVLLVTTAAPENLHRAVRNIAAITYTDVKQLHTYEALNSSTIVFMRGAVDVLGGGQ